MLGRVNDDPRGAVSGASADLAAVPWSAFARTVNGNDDSRGAVSGASADLAAVPWSAIERTTPTARSCAFADSVMRKNLAVALLLATVACGKDKEEAEVPAGTPTKIRIDAISAEIEMPAGTTMTHDAESGRIHLKKGALKVNIIPVDKFSPRYEQLDDPTRENVLEVVRADDVRDDGHVGFVVVLRTKTELYPEPMYEVAVRGSLTIAGGGLDRGYVPGDPLFDCGAAMPTKELADAVVDACLSLRLTLTPAPARSRAVPPPAATSPAVPPPTAMTGAAQPPKKPATASAKPVERANGKQPAARATVSVRSIDRTLTATQPSSGKRTPALIESVVGRARGRVAACYKAGLAKNAELQGRVKATFTIGAGGAVSAVSTAGSTLPDRVVVDCVAGVVRKLEFPKPSGGEEATVVYPFDLHP